MILSIIPITIPITIMTTIIKSPHPSLLSMEKFIYEQGKASGILLYLFALHPYVEKEDKEFQDILIKAYEKAGIENSEYWVLYLLSPSESESE